MNDNAAALETIRAALNPVTPYSSESEINAATEVATEHLRRVARSVAEFANALDDGVGFFNSSTEFGRLLADEFDDVRRGSTVMGLVRGLSVSESLNAAEMALLLTNARTGPSALRRELLGSTESASIQRIGELASSALLDAAMPSDPEDEEDE